MSFWHHLPRPIIGLAPMDGVTDIAFRHVIATYGRPDVVFTEFTNVHDVCHSRGMAWEPLRYTERQRPIVAQLYGKHPDLFYQAAHVVGELGFDGLDINMGCPSKNVASSGSGAGLIRTPELALAIMAATARGLRDWANGQTLAEAGLKPRIVERARMVRDAQEHPASPVQRRVLPLSVKTRLGYDSVIIKEWSACLVQGRPEVISIHGRTLKQMYRGDADWDAIADAAKQIRQQGILVFGNGDIGSLNDAIARIRASGVDGVLLGRASLGNPWIFRGKELIREAVRHRSPYPVHEPSVSLEDRFDMILKHARAFEHFHEARRFPRMRKHLGWYCRDFPYAAALRADMVTVHHAQDVERLLNTYRAERAAPVAVPCEALTAGFLHPQA
ncbi:MAG: tRNA-dihydrouridine synthase [Nitrospira sp.]|nr:tRNA-dihydrouridine synthase [Nitrospira sp.]